MISTDFAANESWDDAILSLKLLLQPWKWRRGEELIKTKKLLLEKLTTEQSGNLAISLFLSGRSALYYLLKGLNLPKGSQILVQGFTCEAVVLPIIELGLKPVYVDIEKETYSMDLNSLTDKPFKQTKVLILQHTFGLSPKFRREILQLAGEKKLIVIEDLAHGFSGNITIEQYNNYYALLSFGRSKMLSSVFGGAILGSTKQPVKHADNLTMPSYGFIFLCLLYKPLTMIIKSAYDLAAGKIIHKILNKLNLLIPEITPREKSGNYDKLFNFAYPNAFAALLNHQLNKLEQVNKNRAKISKIYNSTISKPEQKTHINNWSMIRYPLTVKERERVIKKMREKNIFLGKWYDQVIAPIDLDLKRVEYKTGTCPVAEDICQKIINLPTNIPASEAELLASHLNDVI